METTEMIQNHLDNIFCICIKVKHVLYLRKLLFWRYKHYQAFHLKLWLWICGPVCNVFSPSVSLSQRWNTEDYDVFTSVWVLSYVCVCALYWESIKFINISAVCLSQPEVQLAEDYEVFIPKAQLDSILLNYTRSGSLLFRKLVCAFFDDATLANSLPNGKRKRGLNDHRKGLDQNIVGAIKGEWISTNSSL